MQYTASPVSSRAQLTATTPINVNDNVAAGELQTPDVLASKSEHEVPTSRTAAGDPRLSEAVLYCTPSKHELSSRVSLRATSSSLYFKKSHRMTLYG